MRVVKSKRQHWEPPPEKPEPGEGYVSCTALPEIQKSKPGYMSLGNGAYMKKPIIHK